MCEHLKEKPRCAGLIELHMSLTGWQAIISDAVSIASMSWSRQGYAPSFGLKSVLTALHFPLSLVLIFLSEMQILGGGKSSRVRTTNLQSWLYVSDWLLSPFILLLL